MSIELKIKSKSLAAEARIIRAEEIKLRDTARNRAALQKPVSKLVSSRNSLYRHRIDVVRLEARATFLARAFLAGKPRAVVEANPVSDEAVRKRATKIARKYGKGTEEEFLNWLDA
ncbi:hypothetical protein MAL1_00030 [Bacteriophage DSS3_MAL1]|nr:hypothetical protein MAL1_00030 [Bacteriophage DSS3_MAL1]